MTVKISYKLQPLGNLGGRTLAADSDHIDMAGDGSGSVLLSHDTTLGTATGGTVFGPGGATVAGSVPIAGGGLLDDDPASTALADGSFVTAFYNQSLLQTGTIELQRVARNGAVLGTAFAVDGDALHNQYDPDVAGLKNGNVVVSWTRDQGLGRTGTAFEIFKPNGSKVTSGTVDSQLLLGSSGSSVAGLRNGGFVVADTASVTLGVNQSLHFSLFNAAGVATGSAIDVGATGGIADQAQTLGLRDGGFALAYRSSGGLLSGTDITMKLFNADGSSRGGDVHVNLARDGTGIANNQSDPHLTQLSDGLIAVTWESFNGTSYDIDARLYNARGTALTDVTTLGHATDVGSNGLAAQLLGTFMVGWTDRDSVASAYAAHGGRVGVVRSMTGGTAAERLVGSNGIDHVAAGGGNDRVFLNAGNDRANGGLGNDTIRGGAGRDLLLGGAGNDKLAGDTGNDVLDGGAGRDLLTGGAGHDTFVFSHTPGAANRQHIADFKVGTDHLLLDSRVFGAKLGTSVDADEFTVGTHATTKHQHFVYNAATGHLFYDADGSGGRAQVDMALLGKHLHLSAHDFHIGHPAI